MNKYALRNPSEPSSSEVEMQRSFLKIKFLSPRAKAQAKIVTLKATPVTRWNE
jgi:hypothetical protein